MAELSEVTLRQTQDLLRLVDSSLKEICCRKFTREELYVEALRKVLGHGERRGPESIFIVFKAPGKDALHGRAFYLKRGELVESSELITIDEGATYAINLAREDVVLSNWCDTCESIDAYQRHFHPTVRHFVAAPIRNFICSRVSGQPPGAIIAFNYPEEATNYDADVLQSLAVVIGSLVTLSSEVEETERAFIYTIEALARTCEAAEEHTGRHIVRVNRYAEVLAAGMGLADDFVETISYSAQMHDVGKIKIPVSVLLKEGPLNAEEINLMKRHPEFGVEILGDSPRLKIARDIAISHHENWDGSGYPFQLQGEEIPLAGRIVKVADVYDALRSKRGYKPSYSHKQVMEIFREGDAKINPRAHFDPAVLATFFHIEHLFAQIFDSND